jgi:hypothetical protein
MTTVPASEVEFHPLSFGDFNGRLFSWDGRLLRGVTAKRAGLYRGLVEDGTVGRLVGKGLLVETSVADVGVEGFEVVLEHRRVPFVSYAFEWPMGMLKAAALLTLDLEIELAGRGLTLQDAHPWNVLFDGPRPVWVDFGSIVEAKTDTLWRAYDEFCHFYWNPLRVMAAGQHRVARRMLVDCDDGVQGVEAEAIAGRLRGVMSKVVRLVPASLRRAVASRPTRWEARERIEFLRRVRGRVEAIPIGRAAALTSFARNGAGRGTHRTNPVLAEALARAVGEVRPARIMEVVYEGGFHTVHAADEEGYPKVVAVCVDDNRVEEIFEAAEQEGYDVLPLVMDVRNPSPAMGVCGQTAAAAAQRLACELVVAFGVTHQLGVRYRLNFDQLAAALGTFAKRAVLVDFVPGDHPATRPYWASGDFGWYTRENFEAGLRRRFEAVRTVGESVFLCEGGRA